MHESSPFAAQRCPLCGQANDCAVEAQRSTGRAQPPCWCIQREFSADLLAKLAEPARGRACICRDCASGTSPA